MAAKQYAPKHPMDYWKNQRKLKKNTYRQMKMKAQWSKQQEWSRNKKSLN